MPSSPQTEITPEWSNLNTILALAYEWLEQAIHVGDRFSDFGLPYATQLPGGGQLW